MSFGIVKSAPQAYSNIKIDEKAVARLQIGSREHQSCRICFCEDRDFAQVKGVGKIDLEITKYGLLHSISISTDLMKWITGSYRHH